MTCAERRQQRACRLNGDGELDSELRLAPLAQGRAVDELGRDVRLDLCILVQMGIAFDQERHAADAERVVRVRLPEKARAPLRIVLRLDCLEERDSAVNFATCSE